VADSPALIVRGRRVDTSGTLVMGVVNASPESFSDAGRYDSPERRLELAGALVEAGADIVDVGGQSARTNEPEIDASVEIDRVVPVVEWLHMHWPEVLVSVDTYKPSVARAAVAAGASIINDVSGLADPSLAAICVETSSALVVLHTRARPKVRLQRPDLYADVVTDVVEFLEARIRVATGHGLAREAIIVDPGPDFSKTPHQTLELLRQMGRVRAIGRPVLLALSRKDFLGAILQKTPRGRDVATIAALSHFTAEPGYIVRVHDVPAARDALRTIDALTGRLDIDPDYLLPDSLRYERPD
jgi:dihydropteroate synthase